MFAQQVLNLLSHRPSSQFPSLKWDQKQINSVDVVLSVASGLVPGPRQTYGKNKLSFLTGPHCSPLAQEPSKLEGSPFSPTVFHRPLRHRTYKVSAAPAEVVK